MLDWLTGPIFWQKMDKIGKKISNHERQSGSLFRKTVGELVEKLVYISETDSPFEPVSGGKISNVTIESVLDNLNLERPARDIEETDFDDFFEKLVRRRHWDRPEDSMRRDRFARLRDLLKENLTDIHVFRLGKVQIDIYIVGIDADGRLAGVRTKAVET